MALTGHQSSAVSHQFAPAPFSAPGSQQPPRTTLRGDTPFYAEPDGTVLGTLRAGAAVVLGRVRGAWRQVTFEGWIFTSSTGPSPRPEFTLAVHAAEGENLRNRPDGLQIARAVRGTGFHRVAREGGWTRVRRTAWVKGHDPVREKPAPSRSSKRPAEPVAPAVVSQAPPPPAPPPVAAPERVIVRKGAPLAIGPGGTEVGPAPEDLIGEVVGRAGNWVRIRSETWVRAEDLRPAPAEQAITLERLRDEGDKLIGQSVSWRLQFLSVQRADELRPELTPGQPYLLTRGPLPDVGFVYVAVTPAQAQRFRTKNPLDEFVANGRIRAARTKYLPTPVIELSPEPSP